MAVGISWFWTIFGPNEVLPSNALLQSIYSSLSPPES
jgi:hypothetical protein